MTMTRKTLISACSATVVLGLVTIASSQTPSTSPGLPAGASASAPAASVDAERLKIWNSPTMLRARAWVQEYCQRSATISPAEAQQYMTELEHLSPVQMKLWLLKFDNEEHMIRQQQSDFERTRQAGLSQATSMNAATQQAYGNINRDETAAAQGEQQSLSAEQQQAANRDLQNDASRDANDAAFNGPLFGAYGGYPYGGYNPAGVLGDGIHLHVHVHPQ
jgi:guanyl-specific ribonuclease Sa